ncbi:DNA repair protein RecN [Criibacterium bergeronii]|uniref:DNA repair protein RecN n=1 Tax=Criibacterium bergeronii TaxID=1871336 RepID=A0A371IKB9_9FIRM|nr:DNA repair protein RecN [Criibacterium bergeronii]MBS6063099.1 DNA repair protein RecN [Peptostreptococcaceae bacterium]RDY20911.1 DNA repair protein RecN [Criibacterium bergeronii]
MLKQIYIQDFALIDTLELELEDGFTVFTGETGSGKSILIDAISFALGKRADKSFIRRGKEKSTIELTFFLSEQLIELIKPIFDELDLDLETGVLSIRRQIYSDGKSISKINSKNVTMSNLRLIASYLANIHGQNEFNELDEQNHINILDSYIKIKEKQDYITYVNLYKEFIYKKKEYEKLKSEFNKDDNQTKLEIVNHKIEEIESLKLKKGEDEKISSQLEIAEQSEKINNTINGLYQELYSNSSNIMKTLKRYTEEFEELSHLDKKLAAIHEKLNNEYYNLEEIVYDLRDNMGRYEYEDNSKEELENRYNQINYVFSKYAQGYDELMKYLKALKNKVYELENMEIRLKALKQELTQLHEQVQIYSKKLTEIRKDNIPKLEQQIIKELDTLGIGDTAFKIDISYADSFNQKGRDKILFLVSFNKGEEIKPFSKVASGGEISRFMLALKNVISSDFEKTMIFDEIDTGISGLASERVGRKLKNISSKRQVLCITHQAQIASFAKNHIEVYKTEENGSTFTRAEVLDKTGRVKQIAQMMDSRQDSIKALEHAKELVEKNSKN